MVNWNKQRCKLTLGKIPKSDAIRFAENLEYLKTSKRHRSAIPPELDSWIQSLPNRHAEQLGELGLIGESDFELTVQQTINKFLEDFDQRQDAADSTKKQIRNALKRFPPRLLKKLIADIEPKKHHHRTNAKAVFSSETKALMRSVESWQRNHYSKSTWSTSNKKIRQVGHWAVENGICNYNPFSLLPVPSDANKERNVYVESVWVLDAMDMCHDPDTRLVLALGRFCGIRTPSEARTLKPADIDFEKSQIRIFDSKKKIYRKMPLFNRVREELERHRNDCGGWDRYVLTARFRRTDDANNYNLIKEAIARTQWPQWDKIRQNLRASCENDLLKQFDERLVIEWIGHTITTSRKHYQKQTDADYVEAASAPIF